MIDEIPSNPTTIGSILGGGALVAYIRERRRGKKDAYTFAMDLLSQQNLRIDELVKDIALLNAKYHMTAEALDILKEENAELKAENSRLKTALAEHGRAA